MPALVQPLFDGPIDVVGDVHGHAAALEELLGLLGYDAEGRHPRGRRLVFLGDLVDRGEDSPAVVHRVAALVEAGRAQCLLGNHELNLLLGKERSGNEWFRGERQYSHRGRGRLIPQRLARASERSWMLEFFRSLPLALMRPGLRVVHACWDDRAVARARLERDVVVFHARATRDVEAALRGVEDPVERDLARQNRNPVNLLLSGREVRWPGPPFRAGGRPRQVVRSAWWEDYRDREDVVFGHYWRPLRSIAPLRGRIPGPVFGGSPLAPLGPRGNAWCIDWSVGRRNAVLHTGIGKGNPPSALGALRLCPFEGPVLTRAL